ncbi:MULTISPECIES: K+/H+ antiporter subunit F [Marinobacter]|jgi:multicomponent K+:H+ antiporter subunit F|uniref:Multiple resistance and pH regulation protein F n=1 Tax=Marinobacter manganoxydans MnI7-9 TaxID=1094979 RepID=G6YUZ6_9GAMM|nr:MULTISPECIES: K+/H+ antiporter subunit F [Marinobacter]MCP4062422.1 K+/H+ antiporter subunit F [Gammaproteobacteria bacterium]PTB93404.1 K+/H+ antiporter subunit F [Marinobacter sp. B9-2]HBI79097.1 K+/H+ antiporter subunit F [Marinobacter adhaerens]AKV95266.1 cation:proton antiporter [Marinobacter sp. CP1]EHJ04121.1 multiple resistance and pH regulation protein F [Marinobacter manganoxydans MnI7-9]|tara:strand:- start:6418 stop:6687 length:270 start_codon:yes stop_codon:yes gene_type:complete
MILIALYITIAMVTLAALLNVYRVIKGPDAPDRVLALDTLYVNAIALIVLLGITLQTRMYLESALLIAVMGFVGTVAMAKYLKRGSVIE